MSLPNLAGLGLQGHGGAPTAEFFSLDEDQQKQLKNAGDVEMFSQETPAVHNGGTFRVAKTSGARPDVMTDYDWYDARMLWQWAQTHELDPLRKPWWYEDWLALRDMYAVVPGVPDWVNGLPQLDPSVPKQVLPPLVVNWSSSRETVMAPNSDDAPPSPLAPRRLWFGADDESDEDEPVFRSLHNSDREDDDDVPTPLPVVRQRGERELPRAPLPSFTDARGRRWTHTWVVGWVMRS